MDPENTGGDAAENAERAAEALSELADGPGQAAARALEDAFEAAGKSIEDSLVRAARTGELSFAQMSEAVLQSLARIAIENTVEAAFSGVLNAVVGGGFSGARAAGGFVAPGGSYLVGETGPEVFTPASAGAVSPATQAPPVTVNITMAGASVDQVRRSQGQIAAAVARAVARGERSL